MVRTCNICCLTKCEEPALPGGHHRLRAQRVSRLITLSFYSLHTTCHYSTWQDWGLRCARKTAFHAAVQYYCRQLGIIGHEPPRPIVYADAETMAYVPSSPGLPLEEDGEPEAPVEKMKTSLGFLPPMAARRTNIRPRKSKGRRAILRSMES